MGEEAEGQGLSEQQTESSEGDGTSETSGAGGNPE